MGSPQEKTAGSGLLKVVVDTTKEALHESLGITTSRAKELFHDIAKKERNDQTPQEALQDILDSYKDPAELVFALVVAGNAAQVAELEELNKLLSNVSDSVAVD